MTAKAQAASTPAALPPGLILYGRDAKQRPHASCFLGDTVEAAAHAAQLMGLQMVRLRKAAQRALAAELPEGRIYPASGKAYVPFVAPDLFDRLLAVAGKRGAIEVKAEGRADANEAGTRIPGQAAGKAVSAAPAPAVGGTSGAGSGGGGGPRKPPFDWAEIGIGSLVLATTGHMEGWFEAEVRYTKANDHFVLAWRDWPLEPEISRHRNELALLHPATPGA